MAVAKPVDANGYGCFDQTFPCGRKKVAERVIDKNDILSRIRNHYAVNRRAQHCLKKSGCPP
jgi:hypothetical protein